MNYKVVSFYRYTYFDNPELIRDALGEKCAELRILGRILVASEGINGAFSATVEEADAFKKYLQSIQGLDGLTYREQSVPGHTYHKLVVRVRKEIVHFGHPVDVRNTAPHLLPKDFHSMALAGDDVVLVDARNDYEAQVGTFTHAKTLSIRNFRDFPDVVSELKKVKEKKIVTFCTGGVRCEKASAFLREQGFEHVYQLDGGIINYVNQFPEGLFEGACFVFDDRLVSDVTTPVGKCLHCGAKTSSYINCYNLDCDKLFLCCSACQGETHKTCSDSCSAAPRQRVDKEVPVDARVVGVVENYYAKPSVALVRVTHSSLLDGEEISIRGPTTSLFTQKVGSLRDEAGGTVSRVGRGTLVTFPVSQKVRRHDVVLQ